MVSDPNVFTRSVKKFMLARTATAFHAGEKL